MVCQSVSLLEICIRHECINKCTAVIVLKIPIRNVLFTYFYVSVNVSGVLIL